MFKKILTAFLIFAFAFCLFSCGNNDNQSSESGSDSQETSSPLDDGSSDESNSDKTARYAVEYYFENDDGDYELNDDYTFVGDGIVGQTVVASPLSEVVGYEKTTTSDSRESGLIQSDGKLILKVYYSVVRFSVTFVIDGKNSVQTVKYGTAVAKPTVEGKDGYELKWLLNGKEYDFSSPVLSNLTIVLQAEKWGGIVKPPKS